MRDTKTEIPYCTKLMNTNLAASTYPEASSASVCVASPPTTPGGVGAARQLFIDNRRCVIVDQGLNLEQLNPNDITATGEGVVGEGPLHDRNLSSERSDRQKGLRGPFFASATGHREWPRSNAKCGRYRKHTFNH